MYHPNNHFGWFLFRLLVRGWGILGPMPLPFLRLEGLIFLLVAIAEYSTFPYSWIWFFIFILFPDVFMFGYLYGSRIGAFVYNVGHTYTLPFLIVFVCWIMKYPFGYVIAMVWIGHIGMDRMFGFGLKYADGFRHTHLGMIGRKK